MCTQTGLKARQSKLVLQLDLLAILCHYFDANLLTRGLKGYCKQVETENTFNSFLWLNKMV